LAKNLFNFVSPFWRLDNPYCHKVGKDYWPSWLPAIVPVITIILADIGQIASVGSKIVVEKDWIVVISM
jgi:hypothetical protein